VSDCRQARLWPGHIRIAPLTAEQVGIASTGWQGETPLWYYILREADVCTGGDRLGPVGGRIVAEVLVGLIDADGTSFRHSHGNGGLTTHLASYWPRNGETHPPST